MQQKVEQDSFNEKRKSKQDLSHSDALGMSRAGEGRPTLPQCSLDARTAPSVLRILTHWFLSTTPQSSLSSPLCDRQGA